MTVTPERLEESIKEIFLSVSTESQKAQIEKCFSRKEDLTFEKLNLDSLKTVEALMAMEETLDIDVDLEEFEQIPSMLKFVEYCKSRQQGNG